MILYTDSFSYFQVDKSSPGYCSVTPIYNNADEFYLYFKFLRCLHLFFRALSLRILSMQYHSLKMVWKELWKSCCYIFPYRASPSEDTEFVDLWEKHFSSMESRSSHCCKREGCQTDLPLRFSKVSRALGVLWRGLMALFTAMLTNLAQQNLSLLRDFEDDNHLNAKFVAI